MAWEAVPRLGTSSSAALPTMRTRASCSTDTGVLRSDDLFPGRARRRRREATPFIGANLRAVSFFPVACSVKTERPEGIDGADRVGRASRVDTPRSAVL